MDPIETSRLVIRELRPSDARAMCRLNADLTMMQYMVIPKDRSMKAERGRIERHIRQVYCADGFGVWATVWKETDEFIGRCGLLRQVVEGKSEIEVTYQIASSYWGRGIATEAASAIRDAAFGTFRLSRLIAMVPAENIASRRVAEKIGMCWERDLVWRERAFSLFALHTSTESSSV